MIFIAFDVKFEEKIDEIPPGACTPSKTMKKQCAGSGPLKSEQKTMCKKWTLKK